jgi:hypothetical protein
MRRRSSAGLNIKTAIDDLSTLTEYESDSQWTMHYGDKSYPFSDDTFNRLVPLSPKEYRARKEKELNEMRAAAGLNTKPVFERDQDMQSLQSAAGI